MYIRPNKKKYAGDSNPTHPFFPADPKLLFPIRSQKQTAVSDKCLEKPEIDCNYTI